MTGSIDDADDIVQETLFRAWRGLGTYVSRGSFRAWLYRIATNRTLDLVGSAAHRREVVNTAGEPSWLQPYPHEDNTGDTAVGLDSVGMAFVVALQRLNARQRAVLLLCDVLGFSAAEAAETLATSVGATNSLLQRARAKLAAAGSEVHIETETVDQARMVDEFVQAWKAADAEALVALLSSDAHLTMPPQVLEFVGAATIVGQLLDPDWFAPTDDVLFVPTEASGERGLACYVVDHQAGVARRHCIMLFGGATEVARKITGFTEDRIFDLLKLPATIDV